MHSKGSLPPLSGADIGQDDPPFSFSTAVRNQFDGGLVSVLAKCFIYLPHKRVWFDFRSILSDFFFVSITKWDERDVKKRNNIIGSTAA